MDAKDHTPGHANPNCQDVTAYAVGPLQKAGSKTSATGDAGVTRARRTALPAREQEGGPERPPAAAAPQGSGMVNHRVLRLTPSLAGNNASKSALRAHPRRYMHDYFLI